MQRLMTVAFGRPFGHRGRAVVIGRNDDLINNVNHPVCGFDVSLNHVGILNTQADGEGFSVNGFSGRRRQ